MKTPEELHTTYLHTVGRNSNLLLNMSPNRLGTIDDVDMAAYRELGEWIRPNFATPLAEVRNVTFPPYVTNVSSALLDVPANTKAKVN